MIDVLIQTYNEELNLPHTLASLKGWVNRIFVVDSGSTDGTVEIARAAGAEVAHHAFEGYAKQKNWALDHMAVGVAVDPDPRCGRSGDAGVAG